MRQNSNISISVVITSKIIAIQLTLVPRLILMLLLSLPTPPFLVLLLEMIMIKLMINKNYNYNHHHHHYYFSYHNVTKIIITSIVTIRCIIATIRLTVTPFSHPQAISLHYWILLRSVALSPLFNEPLLFLFIFIFFLPLLPPCTFSLSSVTPRLSLSFLLPSSPIG